MIRVCIGLGILFAFTPMAWGQNLSFGPTISNVWQNQAGVSQVDSIQVEVTGQADNRLSLGAFVEYEVNDFVRLNLSIDNWEESSSFRLTNILEECPLCPVRGNANINFLKSQISLNGKLWLPVKIPYTSIYGIGGITADISWLEDYYDIGLIDVPRLSLQLREVGDQLVNLNKPFHTSYLLGIGVEVWNFTLQGTMRSSLGNEYFKPLNYQGQTYHIVGQSNYLLLTLGYRFKIPPKKEKDS